MRGIVRIFLSWMLIFMLEERNSCAQQVTIHVKNVPLRQVIKMISAQTNVGFVYDVQTLENTPRVSIKVENMPFAKFMDTLLKGHPLKYDFIASMCCISKDVKQYTVKGRVMDEREAPLRYACVSINNRPIKATDSTGAFTIHSIYLGDTLSFSYVGYEPKYIKYNGESNVLAKLAESLYMAPTIVQGYTVKEKANTAGLAKVPVPQNTVYRYVFESLIARIPGLLITPTSGLPGTAYRMQFRGKTSIGIRTTGVLPFNYPLFIIDGVPYATNYNSMLPVSTLNVMGEESGNALGNLNINDIEELKMLKDEDELAPYGSRGANGVILITTKRANTGPTWEVKARIGIGQITFAPKMMNTQQYLEMRQEAFTNDNITPTALKAPDLVSWDSTRYTDFRKNLLGSISRKQDLHAAFSNAAASMQHFFSFGYNDEKAAYPRNVSFNRKTFHSHFSYKRAKSRLQLDAINQVAVSNRKTGLYELAGYSFLPPNIPQTGTETYSLHIGSITSGIELKYHISPSLRFSLNLGYNAIEENNHLVLPVRWQTIFSPNTSFTSHYFIKRSYNSQVIEPVLKYNAGNIDLRYNFILGATMQNLNNRIQNIQIQNIPSVPFTRDTAFDINTLNTALIKHNYLHLFSQVGINLQGKYLMNIMIRRERSNRLRLNNQFRNFGAASMGWVFTNDSSFKRSLPVISHGKIKVSYGVTGSDLYVADNSLGRLYPSNALRGSIITNSPWIAAEDYSWQISRKIELGVELGILENRIFLDVDIYRNRTGNQIIGYPEPAMGLNAIRVSNSPAIVQNQGLEIALQLKNKQSGQLKWNSRLALTLPNNKLLSFPGLATSAYANALVTGKSLTVQQGYKFTGVNPLTGLFEVADLNKDGRIDRYNDFKVWGNFDPKVYGSIDLWLNYKNWNLDIFLEGQVQRGFSILGQVYAYVAPGASTVNLPVEFLNRWRKPGDESNIQRLSANNNIDTRAAISKYLASDARFTSASYLRLQHVSLYYKLPLYKKERVYFKTLTLTLTGDNLYTLTRYKGTDPQTQNIFTPSLQRSFNASVLLSF